jgi:ankyrin repeat protein
VLEKAKTAALAPLKQYLAAGGSPDVLVDMRAGVIPGPEHLAPLLWTAIGCHHVRSHKGSIEALLDANVNLDAVHTERGADETVLMFACQWECCNGPLISLLKGGANPGLQASITQGTALHVAAAKGFADKCRLLLDAGGGRLLQLRDCGGMTPVFSAIPGKHLHIVELLHREYGADLSVIDRHGFTLLHSAASQDAVAIMDYLLTHGVDLNAVNSQGLTALSQAAGAGSVAAVQLLLQRGAEAASGTLHFAVHTGQFEVVQLLLRYGLSATSVAQDGATPLMAACAGGHAAIARLLLQHGADPRVVRDCGDTALHAAVSLCCDRSESALRAEAVSLLQRLEQRQADRAPVLAADATTASVQCLQLLLDAEGDVNAASVSGS